MNFYKGLSVSVYDDFFPEIDEQELDFYAQHIVACPQPALELGSGTGRLLLPLLKRGFDVEGLDCSSEMLAVCKAKAQRNGLAPILYEQYMQHLSLPKKYGCIFSALGTFQQTVDRDEAQRALLKCYEHLMPEGKLIIYLHLPWYDAPTFGDWHQHEPVHNHDNTVVVHEKSVHDPLEQQIFSKYIYEIKRNDVVIEREEAALTIRWYSRYEFQMMLERAGFKAISVTSGYEDAGPFDIMIFSASK